MKKLALLFSLPFLFLDAVGQENEYPGLFWEISGKDLDQSSYLYGTMHTTDKRAFQFDEEVLPAFKECDAFAMELNMEDADQNELVQKLIMDSTYTLKNLLEDDYQKVANFFKDSMNQDIAMFNKMQPMFVSSMISQRNLGQDSSVALDLYFHNKAQEQDKEIIGLEKMEEQIDAFSSIPYEKQEEQLVEAVENAGSADSSMNELINNYVKGDLNALLELTTENQPSENFTEVFLVERNHRMANRAEKHINKESTFIAVGAAHLPGEEGIIELLRKKGYQVQPVQ